MAASPRPHAANASPTAFVTPARSSSSFDRVVVEVDHALLTVGQFAFVARLHIVSEMPIPVHVPPVVRPRWGSFALVCVAYLVATTGEQLLSPVYPTASKDLGLGVGQGGIVFGLLTGSIAVFNLVGGVLLRRMSPGRSDPQRRVHRRRRQRRHRHRTLPHPPDPRPDRAWRQRQACSSQRGFRRWLCSPGPAKKGFAMGIYGVAFSGGLTLAAVLGAIGSSYDWRISFWVAAGLGAVAVIGGAGEARAKPVSGQPARFSLRTVMALPTAVGTVLSVCQYGAIPFLTTFAVDAVGTVRDPRRDGARRRPGDLDPRQGGRRRERRSRRRQGQRPAHRDRAHR